MSLILFPALIAPKHKKTQGSFFSFAQSCDMPLVMERIGEITTVRCVREAFVPIHVATLCPPKLAANMAAIFMS